MSESEGTRGLQSSMTLDLDVYYKYPAAQLNIIVRNDLNGNDGGNVGVGIYPAAATQHPSSYTVPNVYETQRLNLAAYDNQTVNGKVWFFNDTEYSVRKSKWQKDKFGQLSFLSNNSSFTTNPLTTDDNGASFKAYLETTSYTTSGTLSENEIWWTNVTLTGNVTVPSGITLTVTPGVNINFNGYGILLDGGSVNFQGGDPNCVYLKQSGSLKGYFGTIQPAINYAGSGQTVELQARTYPESPSLTSKSNITLTGQGQGSTTLNGSISVTNSLHYSSGSDNEWTIEFE
ncbi:hypothetical protein ABRY23_14065 [Melioribacteraceae bacterium 4301-Me]|uniref:hypothetical protein n=1 Tax=Pyranulibacter aquaticus TaxID=3163344 RepID=UPI0035955E0D